MTPLIRRGLIAEASEHPAVAPQTSEIARVGARRRTIAFAGVGIAAYVIGLIATMPASVMVENAPWRTGVAGTVWNGEAGIAGGGVLRWQWAPLRSLTSLGFAADWRLTGGDNDLGGRALVRPGRTVLDRVSGAMDAAVLSAIQPNLPFTCDLAMQVDFPRIALGGSGQMIEGRLASDVGSCAPKPNGAPTTLPALMLAAEHIGDQTRIRLTPATQRRRTLMEFTLSDDGLLDMRMTPEGATTLPFVGLPAGASIQGRI
jgi:hypothetical protein